MRASTTRLERAFWSLHSRTWDEVLAEPEAVQHIDELTSWLRSHVSDGSVIADLGCGTGNYSLALARHGANVIAVDSAPGMLERAAAKARGASISLVRADLRRPLPLLSRTVDAVLSVYAIQFLEPAAFLREVTRVLRPGGHVLIDTPTPGTRPRGANRETSASHRWFQRAKRVAARAGVATGVVRWHTEEDLTDALAQAGCVVIECRRAARSFALLAEKPALADRGQGGEQ